MTAGFRTYLPGGAIVQLSDDELFYSLYETGVELDSATWSQEGPGSAANYRDVVIPGYTLADVPLLALRSDNDGTWASLIDTSGGDLTYRVFRSGTGDDVNWYFFADRAPPANTSGVGFHLYNASGRRVFASDYPPVRPLGVFSDAGYSGISTAGRTIAHAPMKEGRYSFTTYTYGGLGSCLIGGSTQGYQEFITTGFRRTGIATGAGLSELNRTGQVGPAPTGACSSTASGPSFTRDAEEFRTLIIDVANY